MASKVQFKGIDSLMKTLTKKAEGLDGAVAEAVEETAEIMLRDAKAAVPLDKTKLEDSIDYEIERGDGETTAVISASHPSAMSVEFGTDKTPASPFLRPAFESGKIMLVDAIEEKTRRL